MQPTSTRDSTNAVEIVAVCSLLAAASLAVGYLFRFYLSAAFIPAGDLHAHSELARRYSDLLSSFPPLFYDRALFSGWPAFQFYGFTPHLIAALLARLLSEVYADPYMASVRILCVVNLMLLPWTVYFAARPLVDGALSVRCPGERPAGAGVILAIAAICLAAWFISHDEQFFGLGAGALLRVGLFSQGFGWNLLLAHTGLVLRLAGTQRQGGGSARLPAVATAVVFCLLLLSHPLTAIPAALFALLSSRWIPGAKRLICAHLAGLLLAGFWLAPFIAYAPQYATSDPYPPSGRMLELLFRYPLQYLTEVISLFSKQQSDFHSLLPMLRRLNFGYCLMAVLAAILVLHPVTRKSAAVASTACAIAAAMIVFSSRFTMSSVPFGVHYYRLEGLTVLLCLPLFAGVLVVAAQNRAGVMKFWRLIVLALVCAAATASALGVSNRDHRQALAESRSRDPDQLDVVSFFEQRTGRGSGRVYVEHLTDDSVHPKRSAHLLAAEIQRHSNFEILGGAFIESSATNRYVTAFADGLGARTYHGYFVFRRALKLSTEALIDRLRHLGVTHVVAADGEFLTRLLAAAGAKPYRFGKYTVVELAEPRPVASTPPGGAADDSAEIPSFKAVSYVTRPVAGYIDLTADVPFSHVDYYFQAREPLALNFELLAIDPHGAAFPAEVRALLINGSKEQILNFLKSHPAAKDVQLVPFYYRPANLLARERKDYPPHGATERFERLAGFFDKKLRLVERLLPVAAGKRKPADSSSSLELRWSEHGQRLRVSGMQPGSLVRLNYSYHPFWQPAAANGGAGTRVFRGSLERMFLLAGSAEVELAFDPWESRAVYWGAVVSAFGLLALLLLICIE